MTTLAKVPPVAGLVFQALRAGTGLFGNGEGKNRRGLGINRRYFRAKKEHRFMLFPQALNCYEVSQKEMKLKNRKESTECR